MVGKVAKEGKEEAAARTTTSARVRVGILETMKVLEAGKRGIRKERRVKVGMMAGKTVQIPIRTPIHQKTGARAEESPASRGKKKTEKGVVVLLLATILKA